MRNQSALGHIYSTRVLLIRGVMNVCTVRRRILQATLTALLIPADFMPPDKGADFRDMLFSLSYPTFSLLVRSAS
jgi:hypothetical protein